MWKRNGSLLVSFSFYYLKKPSLYQSYIFSQLGNDKGTVSLDKGDVKAALIFSLYNDGAVQQKLMPFPIKHDHYFW